MNKTFLVKIGFILALFAVGAFMIMSLSATDEVDTTAGALATKVAYGETEITFANDTQTLVKAKNFLSDASVVADPYNQGLYTFNSPAAYSIGYDKNSGYFNIVLMEKPFAPSRLAAESQLKKVLGVNDSALCKLAYMVSVPSYIDVDASGIDYRFSSCAGAVDLP